MKKRFNNQQQGVRKTFRTDYERPGGSTTKNDVFGLRKKLRTTNTYTNTETNKETAADLPLPAGGQASRLLENRKANLSATIKQLKRSFGRDKAERLSPEEFEKRRQMIIRQLRNG